MNPIVPNCFCKLCKGSRKLGDIEFNYEMCKNCLLYFPFLHLSICGYCQGMICECCRKYGFFCRREGGGCVLMIRDIVEVNMNELINFKFVCSKNCCSMMIGREL